MSSSYRSTSVKLIFYAFYVVCMHQIWEFISTHCVQSQSIKCQHNHVTRVYFQCTVHFCLSLFIEKCLFIALGNKVFWNLFFFDKNIATQWVKTPTFKRSNFWNKQPLAMYDIWPNICMYLCIFKNAPCNKNIFQIDYVLCVSAF